MLILLITCEAYKIQVPKLSHRTFRTGDGNCLSVKPSKTIMAQVGNGLRIGEKTDMVQSLF